MQTAREDAVRTYKAPEDHPDPEAYSLATAVLVRTFKTLNENDRREIEETARFLIDTSPNSLLSFWLRIQSGKDPQGSHRMAVCKKIGEKALYHVGQTHDILKNQTMPRGVNQARANAIWVQTFHKVKDIPELAALCG